jgi:hypothetical protein
LFVRLLHEVCASSSCPSLYARIPNASAQAAAAPPAAAAVLRLLAEFELGRPDAALLQNDAVAPGVRSTMAALVQQISEHPNGPATVLANGLRAVLAVIFRDAQTYKSGTTSKTRRFHMCVCIQ